MCALHVPESTMQGLWVLCRDWMWAGGARGMKCGEGYVTAPTVPVHPMTQAQAHSLGQTPHHTHLIVQCAVFKGYIAMYGVVSGPLVPCTCCAAGMHGNSVAIKPGSTIADPQEAVTQF